MKKLLLAFSLCAFGLNAQNFNSTKVTAEYAGTFDPRAAETEAVSFLYPTGAPVPGGDSYKAFLASQKNSSRLPQLSCCFRDTENDDNSQSFGRLWNLHLSPHPKWKPVRFQRWHS